ncbi:hypothetical protein [Lacibacter sediminis]|uniref:Uncharacterized protein n=1 Tax=Lacibacter sediminis TaxID=2760713 RepID=A0A7G5XCI9_9BACT|nr:hypothetical protein [Lacibacter sediminis]QNA43192.1 hypothetical protein H4075_14010 [Lacibacter sediminis]
MKKTASLSFLLFMIIAACKKPKDLPEEQILTSRVFVYDEGRTKQSSLGTSIFVENSNPLITTKANNAGEYQLLTPSTGDSLVIVWAKPGYGTYKVHIKSVNSSLGINDINLGSPSTVTVNSLSATMIGDSVKLTIDISSPNITGEKYVRLIHRKNATGISIDSPIKADGGIYQVQNGVNVLTIAKIAFSNYVPHTGDIIYIRAYGDSFYGNLYSTPSEKLVFPNLNRNTCPETSFAW